MIISIVLGLLATVLSLFGLKCTQVGMNNENTKVKISVTGGVIFILAGKIPTLCIETELRTPLVLNSAFMIKKFINN
uniref:Uncharacterized protein n=1 Tax=Gopherus evgoodei TaxID=1825980 RepID=A0A8C4YKK4_9SAUR